MATSNNFSFVYDGRDITMIEKLPLIFRPIYDYRGMCDASGVEVQSLYSGVTKLLNDQFIQTASAEVLSKWEDYCGIIPNATDTLDERRFRILAVLNDSPPYTDKYLENRLDALCGKGYWRIIRDYNSYSMIVELSIKSVVNTNTVMNLVKDIIPANIHLIVREYKARHSDVAQYTHEELASYTHKEIETLFE